MVPLRVDHFVLALVQDRALALEELLEVDDGQQVAADVRDPEHPRLRAGHQGDRRQRQDFAHFLEARRQAHGPHAVTHAAPQAGRVELLGQAGDMLETATLVIGQQVERAGRGGFPAHF